MWILHTGLFILYLIMYIHDCQVFNTVTYRPALYPVVCVLFSCIALPCFETNWKGVYKQWIGLLEWWDSGMYSFLFDFTLHGAFLQFSVVFIPSFLHFHMCTYTHGCITECIQILGCDCCY